MELNKDKDSIIVVQLILDGGKVIFEVGRSGVDMNPILMISALYVTLFSTLYFDDSTYFNKAIEILEMKLTENQRFSIDIGEFDDKLSESIREKGKDIVGIGCEIDDGGIKSTHLFKPICGLTVSDLVIITTGSINSLINFNPEMDHERTKMIDRLKTRFGKNEKD